jgi:uncharacterized membrane protein YhhN
MEARTIATTLLCGVPFALQYTHHAYYSNDEFKPIINLTIFKIFPALFCIYTNWRCKQTVLAFFFCLIGDVLLQLDSEQLNESTSFPSFFIHGLLAFLVAHLLFIHSFGTLKNIFKDHILINFCTYSLSFGIVFLLWSHIQKDAILKVAVPIYGCILSTLMNRSYALWKLKNNLASKLICLGAIVFTLSDCIIVFHKFQVVDLSEHSREVLVMGTYYLALAFLSMFNYAHHTKEE